MESTTLIIVVITNIILVLVLGGFGFLIYKLLKDQRTGQNFQNPTPPISSAPVIPAAEAGPNYHPEIVKRMKYLEGLKARKAELACPNHPEEPGEVICAICDLHYCQACIRPFKSMYLCKEHLPLVMGNEWMEVTTVKTSTSDPEKGVRLFDIKKDLFQNDSVPSYIETHYKINVDQDFIETYLVMFAKAEEVEEIKTKLEKDL